MQQTEHVLGATALCLLAVASVELTACQSSTVITPGRSGSVPASPPLGTNLGIGDPQLCASLQRQLAQAVSNLGSSYRMVRDFVEFQRKSVDAAEVDAFDDKWRAAFVAEKEKLFGLSTCSDSIAHWARALALWRDIFNYEKGTTSALRTQRRNENAQPLAARIESELLALSEALGIMAANR